MGVWKNLRGGIKITCFFLLSAIAAESFGFGMFPQGIFGVYPLTIIFSCAFLALTLIGFE